MSTEEPNTLSTTFWQRYKYTIVYNFTRLGSFWRGWADAIDGTWDELKAWLTSTIGLPIGVFICLTWPLIAVFGVIWKCFIWPLTYLITRKDDMESFMVKHPDPIQRHTKNFSI